MAIVATGDRDAFQLASELTIILQPMRAGEMTRISPKEVCGRYGVEPKQVPDFIALRGDPSDKLPGATGTAAQRVQRAFYIDMAPSRVRSHMVDSRSRRIVCASTAG
jgi:DNA polymerase-1